jgi:methionine-rich copper-binding protein CopC
VLTFNEPMAAGTGDIVLTPATVGGTAVTLAANGARVTVSGTTVTIDPAADLVPTQTTETYTVTVAAGALTDAAGNAWAGLSGTAYTFVLADSTAPAVASYAPATGATDVAVGTAIVLTFNEAVLAGSGVVVLQSTAGGVSKTLAINDATQVTVSGTTVTLQPAGWLSTGLSTASYTVVMAAGVVTDASAARNAFAGLTAGVYAFTTVDDSAPVLVSTVPAHGAVDVALSSTLVLTFNEPVVTGSGNVVLTASAGSAAVNDCGSGGDGQRQHGDADAGAAARVGAQRAGVLGGDAERLCQGRKQRGVCGHQRRGACVHGGGHGGAVGGVVPPGGPGHRGGGQQRRDPRV